MSGDPGKLKGGSWLSHHDDAAHEAEMVEDYVRNHPVLTPTEPGFYWWRATGTDEWQMVQLVDCGMGAYFIFVQHTQWGIHVFKDAKDKTGQWVKVISPNTK